MGRDGELKKEEVFKIEQALKIERNIGTPEFQISGPNSVRTSLRV